MHFKGFINTRVQQLAETPGKRGCYQYLQTNLQEVERQFGKKESTFGVVSACLTPSIGTLQKTKLFT